MSEVLETLWQLVLLTGLFLLFIFTLYCWIPNAWRWLDRHAPVFAYLILCAAVGIAGFGLLLVFLEQFRDIF